MKIFKRWDCPEAVDAAQSKTTKATKRARRIGKPPCDFRISCTPGGIFGRPTGLGEPYSGARVMSTRIILGGQKYLLRQACLAIIGVHFGQAKMETWVPFGSRMLSLLVLAPLVALPKFAVPNYSDLKIKTRYTFDDWQSQVHTLYLKGAWERTETVTEKPSRADAMNSVVIRQCDERRVFQLNERDKIYESSEIEDWSERQKRARPVPTTQMSGADVTITVDSVDTSERRPLGHYTARHVKILIRFEPGPGASTHASVEEIDGWYLDLPGFGCQEQGSTGFALLFAGTGNRKDRLQIKWLGKAPRGYPIEETSVKTEAGSKTIRKVELLEISEAPLNPSLFDRPTGYRQALQTGDGGADLTRPDTISNRAQYYWTRLTFWVRNLFR